MAIITLPNGAQYDTGLPWNDQPDSGSYTFMGEIQQSQTPVEIKEQTRNPNLERILSQTWTDTSYTGSNYVYKTTYNYKFGSGDSKCFALSGTTDEFKIKSK